MPLDWRLECHFLADPSDTDLPIQEGMGREQAFLC